MGSHIISNVLIVTFLIPNHLFALVKSCTNLPCAATYFLQHSIYWQLIVNSFSIEGFCKGSQWQWCVFDSSIVWSKYWFSDWSWARNAGVSLQFWRSNYSSKILIWEIPSKSLTWEILKFHAMSAMTFY